MRKIIAGFIFAALFFVVAAIYGCTSCSYTPDESSGDITEISEASKGDVVSDDVSDVSKENVSENVSDETPNTSKTPDISDESFGATDVSDLENSTEVSTPPSVQQTGTDTNILDIEALEILKQITRVAEEHNLAVSYIYGDYYYSINGSKKYSSASTIKAIYCQYLMEIGVDFNEKIVFETDADRSSSSGKFTEKHKGETFTVGELIKYTIEYSDNMAYRLLFEKYGYKGFNEYVKTIGVPGLAFSSSREFTKVTAKELSAGMWELLEFSSTDKRLVDHLINAKNKRQIAAGTDYKVASKYGYNGSTNGYHDTAIVFAPDPYVLTIMSNLDPGSDANARTPFATITTLTDKLHEALSNCDTNSGNNDASKEDASTDIVPEVSKPAEEDNKFVFTLNMTGGLTQGNPYMMEDSVVTVTGFVQDKINGIVSVNVSGGDGEPRATINEDGTYTIKFSTKHPNTTYKLTFTAVNGAGKTISITKYVHYKRSDPPRISFAEGFDSENNYKTITVDSGIKTLSYLFEGSASNDFDINIKSVTINGVAATLTQNANGSINWSVTLSKLPVNTVIKLTIRATNSVGTSTTIERYVLFNSPSLTENTVFAIYSSDDNSLTFYNRALTAKVGEKFNGKTVTKLYTGFDTIEYTSRRQQPWTEEFDVIKLVKVEDEFAPISTAHWFEGLTYCSSVDLRKLNIQRVNNMSYMFRQTGRFVENLVIVGIEDWNTANVTDMTSMFRYAGESASFSLDLSHWNVSSVTSYSDFNYDVEDKVIAPNFK